MASDFTLEAVISAQTDQFEGALSSLIDSVNEASDALRSKLVAGADEAGEGLEHLKAKSEEAGEGFNAQFSEMRESVTHLIEILGVLEGVNILREQISSAFEFGESLTKLSISTGASTQFLQQLQFAAGATGTSLDNLTMVAGRLQKAYASIQSGSGSHQLLASLKDAGVDASSLSTLKTGIEAIAGAVQKFGENSGIARNLVLQLLGRGGLNELPMLASFTELTAKSEELKVILGSDLVEKLDSTQESLNILGQVVKADAERFAVAFAPAVKAAAELLTNLGVSIATLEQGDGMKSFSATMVNGLVDVAQALVTGESKLIHFAETFETVVEDIQSAASFFKGVGLGLAEGIPNAPAAGPSSAGDANIQSQRDALEKLRQKSLADINQPTAPPPPPTDQSIPATESAAKMAAAAKKAAADALAAFKEQLVGFTEEQAMEVAIGNNTMQAKIAAAHNVTQETIALLSELGPATSKEYQAGVKEAEKAAIQEMNARRELLAQTKALDMQQVNDIASNQVAMLALQKGTLAQELDLHQITKQQELQGEMQLLAQEESIRQNALDQEIARDTTTLKEKETLNEEKLKLDLDYEAKKQALTTQSFADQEQKTTQAATAMGQEFEKGLSTVEQAFQTKGTTWRSIMLDVFKDIESGFNSMITKMIEKWLESSTIFQGLTGGGGAGGKVGGAGMGGAVGAIGGGINAAMGGPTAQMFAPGGAIGSSPGASPGNPGSLGGLTPQMFQQPLQEAFQSISGTVSSVFQQAFSSSSGVLHSVFSTAMQGMSAVMGAVGGGGGAGMQTEIKKLAPLLMQLVASSAQSLVHLAVMAAAEIEQLAQGAELLAVEISAAFKVLGTGFAGAYVGPDFGPPVNDGKGGVLGVVHPGERIIPAAYVDQHSRQLKASAMSMPKMSPGAQQMSSGESGGGDDGGGGHHIEIHTHGDYSSLDSSGMDSVLAQHGGKIAAAVVNHLGNMGGRERYR